MALAISILFAAAVLLAVGLAAAGRIDGMSRAVPDAPPGLPDGEVTPDALRRVTLPVVLRGYRMADVDYALERAAAELERARAAAGMTTSTPSPSDEPQPYDEGSLADDPRHDTARDTVDDTIDG
ncbi:MAG TPA: DivIVA domain-containing protein [Frankiaceae bacterium]|jgi:DivIVA domain-containing protein|nr:DivIVA domain-containing protein [Frankiaceae bacterium]